MRIGRLADAADVDTKTMRYDESDGTDVTPTRFAKRLHAARSTICEAVT